MTEHNHLTQAEWADLMSDTDLPKEAKSAFKENLVIASRQRENIVQEREELAKRLIELENRMYSDSDIVTVLETRENEIAKLQHATFEERLRYVSKIDVRVTIAEGVAHFTSKLHLSASGPVALLTAPTAF
jgi:hypothetical protein